MKGHSSSRAKSREFARRWNERKRIEESAREHARFLEREQARQERLLAVHREHARQERLLAALAGDDEQKRAIWRARIDIALNGVDAAATWAAALFGVCDPDTVELIAIDGISGEATARERWRRKIESAME